MDRGGERGSDLSEEEEDPQLDDRLDVEPARPDEVLEAVG